MTPVLNLRPLSTQSDARLVELIRGGSEPAFETLASRYRRQLLIYADRLAGTDGRAEDVLQQALMQAWIALRDGAEVGHVRPWLYRIVHNSAVNMLRRARLECVELNEALDAATPDEGQESRLVLQEIFAGLAVMPEPQREAILMTAVRGSTHVEAATALGLSDGAVRGLIYRARRSLRHAAAGLLPVGLWNWAAGFARRGSLGGDAGDAVGAAGSMGAAVAVMKGGAILAAAGALAGAGQAVLPTMTGSGGQTRPAHHQSRQPSRTGGRPAPQADSIAATRAALISLRGEHEGPGAQLRRHDGHSVGTERGGGPRHGGNGDRRSASRRGNRTETQSANGGTLDGGAGPGPSTSDSGSGSSGSDTTSGSGSGGGSSGSGTTSGSGSGGGSSGSGTTSGTGSTSGSDGGGSASATATTASVPTTDSVSGSTGGDTGSAREGGSTSSSSVSGGGSSGG